ncbi:ATP synthase F1 subunit delta [Euzebya tangerina]|uniref:ATP synthase F1 subunit delta n=1 Tax=Euzebya tangerina TaxID=591198 RepID=UPI000E31AE27|nr:ATP synthase F1 subunit delta [Euzebya tangerina]
MADDLATAYGKAITTIARAEGVADRVADELFQFAEAVDTTNELRDKLTDPSVPLEARSTAVSDLLSKAHTTTASAVQLLLSASQIRNVGSIAKVVISEAAEARGASVATVRSAKPISERQRLALGKALEQREGRPVEVKVVVDPDLLGGIVVQLGDNVIDGSVAKQLTEIRATLASA